MTSLNLLLGGNELNSGIANKLTSADDDLFVVDWKSNNTGTGELIKLDATDSNLPIELKNRGLGAFSSVWTSMDLAVPNLNQILINSSLMGFEGGLVPLTKQAMMDTWAKKGLAGREFRVVNQQDYMTWEFQSSDMPQIVKPNIGSGSRGVTICSTTQELLTAIPESMTISQDKKVIIEDFIEGTEFTAELLADQFGNIQLLAFSEKHHSRHIVKSKVATALIYGWTSLSAFEVQELIDFTIEAFRAFEPTSTLGHLEVIYSKISRKFTPVEIGFRSSGYIASHLVDISTGIDFMSLTNSIYNGGRVIERYKDPEKVGVYYFYDLPENRNFNLVKSISSYLDNCKSLVRKTNDFSMEKTWKITGDADRYGFEVLQITDEQFSLDKLLEAETRLINDSQTS